MPSDNISAIRDESSDLRSRCGRLREHSRDLRLRSQHCRGRVARAAEDVGRAAASLVAGQETDGAAHRARLMRAEKDLQAAIAECTAALHEVRRELHHREDIDIATAVVH
jgi:chromosome segregation ATPase